MLKFRMSNSMKARRAAEAQRRALEEKLKMEWAWKPMAAVMNEKESDLVYWVPPLYTSNLLTSFSTSRSSSLCSSLSSSPSTSFKRASLKRTSSVKLLQTSLAETSPTRKKKLSRRRAKLSPEWSIQEDDDEDPETNEAKKRKDEPTTDDDKESGIHEEFVDSSSMDDELQKEGPAKIRVRPISRQSSKRSNKCFSKKQEKFKHIPTLLKVINKLATIYSLPTRPTPIVAARRLERNKLLRNNSIKRPKRPSVKIYSVPPLRASLKKCQLTEESAKPDPYFVITRNKTPFGSRQQSISLGSRQPSFSFGSRQQSFSETASNNRTHIGLPTLSETELRNAHLEMILKILANLYEEKLVNQSTEISQLKSKLQGQEKLLKQTAHVVINVQEQLKTLQAKFDYNEKLQKFYRRETPVIEPSFPYHPLEPLPEESSDSSQKVHRKLSHEQKFTYPENTEDFCPKFEICDMSYLELSQNSSPSSFDDSSEHTPSILISGDTEARAKDDVTSVYSIPKSDPCPSMLTATSPVVLKSEESQRRASTPIGIPRSILKTSQSRSLDLTLANESILTSSEFDSTFFSSGEIPLSPFSQSDHSNHMESHSIVLQLGSSPNVQSQTVNEHKVPALCNQHPTECITAWKSTCKSDLSTFSNNRPRTTADIHSPPSNLPKTQPTVEVPTDVFKSVLVIEIGQEKNS